MLLNTLARRYSPRTIKLYLYHNKRLLEFFKNNPHEVSNADIKGLSDYLYHLASDRRASTSTLNTAIKVFPVVSGHGTGRTHR